MITTRKVDENAIRQVIEKYMGYKIERIKDDDDLFQNLGIDSISALEILALIEKELDVHFPDYQLAEINNIRAIKKALGI